MSDLKMKDMMRNVYAKTVEGPVGQAVKYLDDCVLTATKRGLYKTVALWKCCAIVIDHIRVQREALLVAAEVIRLFEEGDVKGTAFAIAEFKKMATKARLHQYVEPTEYPKLEAQFQTPGKA